MSRARQSGNVLFLILIAVALFAALTYTVTRSTRSSGDGQIPAEKAGIAASAVLEYTASLRAAITRVRAGNACTDTQINFYNKVHWYNYTNPSAPASKKCDIFDPKGGNMVYIPPEKLLKVTADVPVSSIVEHFIGNTDIPQIGTNCSTPACTDLYFMIQITDTIAGAAQFCQAMNEKLKITSIAAFKTVPDLTVSIWGWPPFVGTYTNPGSPAPDSRLNGMEAACYHDTTNGYYTYYQVLIAR